MTTLVKEFERPVYNAAYRMAGNADDAADITQTTFLKTFQNIEKFKPSYRLFSWIYRIALNESINLIKRRPRSTPLENTIAADIPSAGDIVDAGRLGENVQAALLQLSEDYRSVIVLRYFTGCNYEEIASTLGIPVKTVKSRLYSARQLLRKSLENNPVFNT